MKKAVAAALCLWLLAGALAGCQSGDDGPVTATTVAMDTVVEQQAWGKNATEAMRQVNLALAEHEKRFSLYTEDGDIARINAAAGGAAVAVAPETQALLRQALSLSAQSDGAFAITIAPFTLAWGVTGTAPRVLTEAEIARLLPLVDDTALELGEGTARLEKAGMAIDLGGIAKGAACGLAAGIYEEYGVDSALLWIGGNVYARGRKPDGSRFSVGFKDPREGGAYLAALEMEDEVIAVSGGYERFFEAGGKRYIHIIDPRTGWPVESDILSVGAISTDGAEADFWSTTLFVWGKERALEWMEAGGQAILLGEDGVLYVSAALEERFTLHVEDCTVEFVG